MVGSLHEQSEEMLDLSLYRCLEFGLRGRSRNAQIRPSKSDGASSAPVEDADTVPAGSDGKPVEHKRRPARDNLSDDRETASVALIRIRSGYVTHAKPGISIESALGRRRNPTPAVLQAPRWVAASLSSPLQVAGPALSRAEAKSLHPTDGKTQGRWQGAFYGNRGEVR